MLKLCIYLKIILCRLATLLLQKRWVLAYIVFFGYFCQYLHRSNFNLAVVCMARLRHRTDIPDRSVNVSGVTMPTTTTAMSEKTDASGCGQVTDSLDEDNERAEFEWERAVVSGMLSSYYYGAVITQALGGYAAIRLGGKAVVVITMVTQGICCLLLPALTRESHVYVYVLRAITGLAAGPVSPAYFTVWSKWAPPHERGKLLNFSLLGGIVGTVVSFSTSGVLCAYGFDRGWGSIFYIHGIVTAVFVVVWAGFVSDTPETHPSITEAEREYITEAVGLKAAAKPKAVKVPWMSIVTSRAVAALAVTQVCYSWVYYTILTMLPLYMREVLHFQIQQNGLLTALPHVCYGCVAVVVGIVSDHVIKNAVMSVKFSRRLFQAVSFIGTSVCMLVVTVLPCGSKMAVVATMCVGTGMLGLSQGGYYLNSVDFAPRFCGVIYGLCNSISCIAGTVAPLVAGLLTSEGTRSEWNHVFYVCIAVCVLGLLVFSFLSQTEVQVWAIEEGFNQSVVIDKAGDVDIKDIGEENIEINKNNSNINVQKRGQAYAYHRKNRREK